MEEASSIDQGLVEKEGRLLTYLYVWAQLYSIYMMEKHRHNIQTHPYDQVQRFEHWKWKLSKNCEFSPVSQLIVR